MVSQYTDSIYGGGKIEKGELKLSLKVKYLVSCIAPNDRSA